LITSLVLEILFGLLVDTPFPLLGIAGNLADGGPISGVVGNRNDLGLIALVGAVSFVIELRTKSLQRWPAIGSLVLASMVMVLTRSPIAWGTTFVVIAAAAVLYALRRTSSKHRRAWQFGTLGAAAIVALVVWAVRSPIVTALNATGELNYRLELWREMWTLLQLHFVEGWGWIGQWDRGISPYVSFGAATDRLTVSASNAYLDVWFQLGIAGLALFLVLVALAFVRSWLLASRKRSVVYTWPALVLAALLTASLAESSILIEFGWMTFVICCVKASQSLSWRTAFREPLEQEPL
jgi:O-antigen ligase